MDKVLDITKNGWHPEKNGGSGSIRKDVAGWVGKGKKPDEAAKDHVSQPLSSLKDPKSFGPPPKNIGYGGSPIAASSVSQITNTPVATVQDDVQQERAAPSEPEGPAGPYRVDTTGLDTSNLPKPPVRRLDNEASLAPTRVSAARKPKPALPPRFPPRQASAVPLSPPPSYGAATQSEYPQDPYFNRGTLNRLTKAGASVPGLGIGTDASKSNEHSSGAQTSSNGISDLQPRFSKLSSQTTPSSLSTSGGTTLAQKQSALKIASSLHKDPSSVTPNDAKSAVTTANDFRERHGDQVATGWQGANSLNKEYGISSRVGGITTTQQRSVPTPSTKPGSPGKKPAPPPPPKRVGVQGQASDEPPPIPLATRPR